MSMIRTFTILAAVTASSAAFADKPAPPAAKPAAPAPAEKPAAKPADPKLQLSADDAKRFYAFFEKLVSVVVVNKEDCAKMASGINTHIDASQALLKEAGDAKAAGKELPPETKDKITKKTTDELIPAMKHKCAADKAVTDAFMRLKPPSATK